MKQSSWACTIFIQLSLCLVVYVSLHLGHPFFFSTNASDNATPLDLHFISVAGGFRPLHSQTRLLRLVCFSCSFVFGWNMEFVFTSAISLIIESIGFRIKVWFFIEFLASSELKVWVFKNRVLYFSLVYKRLLYLCCYCLINEDGESCRNLQGNICGEHKWIWKRRSTLPKCELFKVNLRFLVNLLWLLEL